MAKQSYILSLPLVTEEWQEDVLSKRLEIARNMYNACLGRLMKRYRRMKQDKEYRCWVQQKASKERSQALRELIKKHELSEYSIHAFVKPMQHYFKENIDSLTAQKIATRSWRTFEKYLFHKDTKVKGNSISL
ncbi:hypothetical protein QA612_02580 [Evansella sp. AB-P1]|uniref:hypothetical protein n=1 Tax=Evansella sp. AB-P1 TaxID=3037653 RepID=UPI00241E853B|nr:hypothetical protein [Evansella sp. AB-P1]MDG5786361.1 hypothetical protein [Evansella sp. AB-P1]